MSKFGDKEENTGEEGTQAVAGAATDCGRGSGGIRRFVTSGGIVSTERFKAGVAESAASGRETKVSKRTGLPFET